LGRGEVEGGGRLREGFAMLRGWPQPAGYWTRVQVVLGTVLGRTGPGTGRLAARLR